MSRIGCVATAVGVLLLATGLSAHHSVATEFDVTNCRDFVGTLTKIDWENPHMHFSVDVKDASGKVEPWLFQSYSTLTMKRAGTERQDFVNNLGKEVWVRGCVARSGTQHKAAAGTLKFTADGRLRQVGQLQDN